MFGRVAIANADIPVAAPDADHIAFFDAFEPKRHGVDDIGKVERPLVPAGFKDLGIHASGLIKGHRFLRGPRLFVQLQHARKQPSRACGPKHCAMLRLKPPGQSDMIGMVMGHNHPADRFPSQWASQYLFPNCARAFGGEPGVYDGPAFTIIQRIDIHMVQSHRQRQPDPKHPFSDFDGLSFGGRLGPGVP